MREAQVSFNVSSDQLEVSARLWLQLDGPRPPAGYSCDGCSNSPDKYISPLSRKVFKVWPACVIHDYHYREAGVLTRDAAGRREADRVLRENIRLCVKFCGGNRFAQERVAWLYWGRVRMWGASSFRHWVKGAKPTSWWKRLRRVW